MAGPPIHHIGILVSDIDDAIERWSTVLGYRFTAVARYKTENYVDHSDPEPHAHDARIAFSYEGPPYIELMEFTGRGTHSESEGQGFHHFGFLEYPDVEGRMAELAKLGIGDDGRVLNDKGDVILWFTDKSALDGVRLEYVSSAAQPIVTDDGSSLPTDAQGRPTLFDE